MEQKSNLLTNNQNARDQDFLALYNVTQVTDNLFTKHLQNFETIRNETLVNIFNIQSKQNACNVEIRNAFSKITTLEGKVSDDSGKIHNLIGQIADDGRKGSIRYFHQIISL